MMTSKPAAWKRVLAACLAVVLAQLQGPGQALAQRRPAEPEANPSFQQELGAQPPGGGGPIGAEPAEPPPGGVQIGATPEDEAAAAPPANPLDTRIIVRVKAAPLSTFLDTISAQARVNFIITEGLEKKRVTAFLQNVTVREALQILLEIKGLTYQRIGRSNTYVVSPRAKGVPNRITRIYTLNYIPLVRVDAGTDNFSPQASGQEQGSGQQQPIVIQPPSRGGQDGGPTADEGGVAIINVIRSVLSKTYGSIAVDARTNALIVTDIPEVFPQVEQIIAELDRKAPQVMIEAQIVEINSDRLQELGLEWGDDKGTLGRFIGGARDTNFPLSIPTPNSRLQFFDPFTKQLSGLGAQVLGGGNSAQSIEEVGELLQDFQYLSSVVDLTSLKVILRALVSRAEARFLGKPKVLTLNNKPALIQTAADTAVALVATQQSGGQGLAQQAIEPQRYSTGLKLKVTPQVNREGYITMLVEPSFTNVIQSQVSTLNNPVFNPNTRGASTLVRVKNGQTLVLGGLLESRETKQVRKVPFLGYIPLIGWLFTSSSTQRFNTDLVIFVTPTIVTD